jgi:hypothetical protein
MRPRLGIPLKRANLTDRSALIEVAGALPSSHSSFCEEVFSVCVVVGIVDPGRRDHRSRLQPNEVDRTNILAPGSVPAAAEITFFPPSPSLLTIGPIGKLYPVTAAQLLPILTGFLASIHF